MSWIIFFDFSLNGLYALHCCRSAWRSCRWGWLSISFSSSRTGEFSVCFTTACGNPYTLKSMSTSSSWRDQCPPTGPLVLSRSASTSLSVSLPFSLRSTNKLVFLQSREKRVSISWALERDVCSVTTSRPVLWIGFGFGWVGWLSSACRATSETQFLHPTISQGNLRRRSRWRIYFLVYDFSSFHLDSLRDTISWECVVKDDCVRHCLIELQSFPLSKLYIDPVQWFDVSSMFSACTMQDAVLLGQCYSDLCVLCSKDPQTWKIPSVCCSNFVLPEFVMECKLIAHPMWEKYSKKLFGINTLSCNEGSMGLRPEWPWRARR